MIQSEVRSYPLQLQAEQEVLVVSGASLLAVAMVNNLPCLLALVDPRIDGLQPVKIRLVQAGVPWESPDGTCYMHLGHLTVYGSLIYVALQMLGGTQVQLIGSSVGSSTTSLG